MIAVKGMSMPKNCRECYFCSFVCDATSRIIKNLDIRPKWCPLVEVPDDEVFGKAEQLTDKEQRIFLAAMAREEKVCKEMDAKRTREPYEISLVSICREIKRKVKKALWTI